MKKITTAMVAFALLPFVSMAQEDKKEKNEREQITERREGIEKKERPERKESQEIIIRQNSDKEIKVKVEIDGDKITINGKPMSEFNDKDITINKRKITINDGNDMMSWNFNGDGKDWEKWGEAFGKSFEGNWNENNDGAFLGVTTEKEGNAAKVMEVTTGSAAEKAGLKKGDIIIKIDEEKITSPDALSDMIAFKKPSDEVTITYKRDGKQSITKATLGKRKSTNNAFAKPRIHSFSVPHPPAPPAVNMEGFNEDMLELQQNAMESAFPSRKKIGLKIQDTEEGNGVKIINVEDSSAAASAGIKKEDIIIEINGKKIENTDDAREELAPDEARKLYKIKINRGGSDMNFEVKIPKKLKTANL